MTDQTRVTHRVLTRPAYVGLGANVGDAAATLASAIVALARSPMLRLTAVSRLYRTRPVGVTNQPDFLNAVARFLVRFRGTPVEGAELLLDICKATEQALGRQPRDRWGPREIDLDVLAFGRERLLVPSPSGHGPPRLTVPHPEARHRLFVLAPWAELAPRFVPPGWAERVETARRRREEVEGPGAVVPVARWHGEGWEALPQDGRSWLLLS